MMDTPLQLWEAGLRSQLDEKQPHDFTGVQEIIDKTVVYDQLVARHNHLVSLVPKEITPDTEADVRLMLAEIDRNMQQQILPLMEELEQLCAKSPFFQRT